MVRASSLNFSRNSSRRSPWKRSGTISTFTATGVWSSRWRLVDGAEAALRDDAVDENCNRGARADDRTILCFFLMGPSEGRNRCGVEKRARRRPGRGAELAVGVVAPAITAPEPHRERAGGVAASGGGEGTVVATGARVIAAPGTNGGS